MPPGTDTGSARSALTAGVGAALALALPAAVVAQVLDAVRDDGERAGPLTYTLAAVVLAGVALGGYVTGRRTRPAGWLGAATGALAVGVVLAIGVTRRVVAGDDPAWGTVPAIVAVAAATGAVSALVARRAGRTRP